jgi:hypothetical protein
VVNAVGDMVNASTSTKEVPDSGDWLPKQGVSWTLRGCLFRSDRHMNSMAAMEVWCVMDRKYEIMC